MQLFGLAPGGVVWRVGQRTEWVGELRGLLILFLSSQAQQDPFYLVQASDLVLDVFREG